MATEFKPYIFFYGRCAEALEFYQTVFGGTSQIMRVSDTPMASEMPPAAQNAVMHASFTSDDAAFLASDGQQTKAVDPDAGNIALSLQFDDASRGERVFEALSQGGNVSSPIGPAFWGGRFGNVVDKFGTEWAIVLP
jgi:PhnB protein